VGDLQQARRFLAEHHQAVLITRKSDGAPQSSPVTAGIDQEGRAVISSRSMLAKVNNLRRDPRATLCVVTEAWFGPWVQVDGRAEIVVLPEALDLLVDVYRAIRGEHPDWAEYREAMVREERVVIRIAIERAAGPAVS
jgi:PPOX class probable F420-dependent enzyme